MTVVLMHQFCPKSSRDSISKNNQHEPFEPQQRVQTTTRSYSTKSVLRVTLPSCLSVSSSALLGGQRQRFRCCCASNRDVSVDQSPSLNEQQPVSTPVHTSHHVHQAIYRSFHQCITYFPSSQSDFLSSSLVQSDDRSILILQKRVHVCLLVATVGSIVVSWNQISRPQTRTFTTRGLYPVDQTIDIPHTWRSRLRGNYDRYTHKKSIVSSYYHIIKGLIEFSFRIH